MNSVLLRQSFLYSNRDWLDVTCDDGHCIEPLDRPFGRRHHSKIDCLDAAACDVVDNLDTTTLSDMTYLHHVCLDIPMERRTVIRIPF